MPVKNDARTPLSSRIPLADMVAGLSVAGLLSAEAVAYSSIAGLTPEHAIFAAVTGLVVYALYGRSPFAIVSPTSSSAAILAAAIATLPVADASQKVELAYALVLCTGLIFLVAGVVRLGAIANFISRPVLHGFAFGLAVTIVIKQLPAIAGVAAKGDVFQVIAGLASQATHWRAAPLIIGGASLVVLFALKRFPALPGAFVVLALAIAAAVAGNLCSGSLACVGPINTTPQLPGIPTLTLETWSRIAQLAGPLALIVYAESWGSMRTYALRHNETLDADHELRALGLANLAAGLLRGMPVGAGFSATSANEAAGAQSRLSGFAAALAIVALMFVGVRFIAQLPEATLAAVVISALAHALDPRPLLRLWRLGRDQYVATATAASVLAFGVLNGMLIAIALSLIAVLQRFSRPQIMQLGCLAGSRDFVDVARHPEAVSEAGIAIFRPAEPIFFANCERIFHAIEMRLATLSPAPTLSPVYCVIVSLEMSSDLDSTSAEALSEFAARLARDGKTLMFARVKDAIRDLLIRAGDIELASSERSYFSVADAHDAAMAVLRRHGGAAKAD